ncbi:TetR/AcrR family transcriptional regulator [Mycobacterium sp. GA-2829]|uniref:TetR/AcrR family transcriptional regulator n=1 Tax=Mycobacterium sp. GA-2829 TaxID=1772283 RepID=UPI00073FC861|nr:TetR/AcrR family transcriptional regulator [Mycobacterium sp. GA-2829]KUI28598.1 TetR family transcriptional regulator [Mycobacterium sp. GA-2829]
MELADSVDADAGRPARGRRRDPLTRENVLASTRRILAGQGYDHVTVERVAREAGVSRPTVYRRWPSKAHIVFDAAFQTADSAEILSSTGDFAADLRRFVRAVLEFWREPAVYAAALGILAERQRDPELSIRAQQLLDKATQAAFTELVHDGVRQGAVPADVDPEFLYDTVVGSAFYAVQVRGVTDFDAFVTNLCTLVTRQR